MAEIDHEAGSGKATWGGRGSISRRAHPVGDVANEKYFALASSRLDRALILHVHVVIRPILMTLFVPFEARGQNR